MILTREQVEAARTVYSASTKNPLVVRHVVNRCDTLDARDAEIAALKASRDGVVADCERMAEEIAALKGHVARLEEAALAGYEINATALLAERDALKARCTEAEAENVEQARLLGIAGSEIAALQAAVESWKREEVIRDFAVT